MKKLAVLFFLIIVPVYFFYPRYYKAVVFIDGNRKKVLIPENVISKAIGMRKFEDKYHDFDGMLFVLEEKRQFNTKNMKHYVLICSLTKKGKDYRIEKCRCIPPNVENYNPNSLYVYEELYKDKFCLSK